MDSLIKYLNISFFVAILISVVTLHSCDGTEVEFCNEETHPHLATIDIEFVWDDNISKYNHIIPDSIYILSSRIIDSWRCGYITTTKAYNNKGRYTFNNPENETDEIDIIIDTTQPEIDGESITEEDIATEEDVATEEEDIDASVTTESESQSEPFKLKKGEYRFIAVNYSENNDAFEYVGLTPETIKDAIENKELLIKYKSYKLYDENIDKYGNDWTDFNPYSDYVKTNISSIYFEYTDVQSVIPGSFNKLSLTPRSATQDIEIIFAIERENVVVEKIMGEVSGIAQSFNILTGETDPSRTYKMLMMLEPKNATDNNDADMNGISTYSGKFSVTALVSNESPEYKSGAGILQLAIYTYTYDDEGNKKQKVLNVGINMYNTINQYGRIIYGKSEPVILNIDNILTINRDKIEEVADGEDGFDKWIIYDDIDIDL